MIKVNVILHNILWKKYLKNPRQFIETRINLLNKKNNTHKNKHLICTLLLSDTKEIKKLNKKFRNKDKSTDVLSFPFYSKKQLVSKIKIQNEIYIGDIILNLAKVKNKKNQIKFKEEFNKLWIHGLIHLFGYKHTKNKDFFKMNKLEKKFYDYLS